MKIREGSFLALLLLAITGICQARQADANKSLLWRISGGHMQKPSYLFGTIHMICQDDYVWTPPMQKSLDKADVVCFEMDLDDPGILQQITVGMFNNSGKTLKDYFSDTDYTRLEKYMRDSVGLDISGFQQLKPVALQSMLTKKELACKSPVSYEANIMELAQKDKKEILGLEKAEEQLDLFDNLPSDSVAKEIIEFIDGKNNEQASYEKLISVYKRQDLPELHRLIQKSEGIDFDMRGFIDTRNEKWIPRMVEKMDQQSVFFAVGAGHLWGKEGVIGLLRKAGYTVEPVK